MDEEQIVWIWWINDGDSSYRVNPDIYGYCLHGININGNGPFKGIQFVWRDVDGVDLKFEIIDHDNDENGDGDNDDIVVVVIVICAVVLFAIIGYFVHKRYAKKKQTKQTEQTFYVEMNSNHNNSTIWSN